MSPPATRGRGVWFRPFYATVLIFTLLAVYSIFLRGPGVTRHIEKSLVARSGEECHLVHAADDKCAFVRRNCQDDEAGLIQYLSFYYCTLSSAQPLALIILIAWLGMLFTTIGIAASDFFSVNLSTIATILGLSESLAGVTFLAFGNGSPDVFSTFAAMGSNSGSMAVGELLGAAGFITSVVAGSMALVREFKVSKKTFVRDICFFIVAVSFTIGFLSDGDVHLWECCCMIGFYVFYVFIVVGWHAYVKRMKARRAREALSRSHYNAAHSQERNDELEPYQDEPDDEDTTPASRRGVGIVDISALERGSRIGTGNDNDHDDDESDRAQHVAAEMTSSMRVNRPRGRRSNTTITAIRPSLIGALEFRSILASLQDERNMRMDPIQSRRHSEHTATIGVNAGSGAVMSAPLVRETVEGDAIIRDRAQSSSAIPHILDDDLVLPTSDSPAGWQLDMGASSHTIDGMLAPPPMGFAAGHATGSHGIEHQTQPTSPKQLQLTIPSSSLPTSGNSSPSLSPFPRYTDSPMPMTPNALLQSHQTLSTTDAERQSEFSNPFFVEVHKPVKWWPYSILPAPHVLMATLFPTLQNWHDKSIWDKIVSLISVPSIFLLVITLPVVESETTNDDDSEADRMEQETGTPAGLGSTAAAVSYEPSSSIEPETEWQQYRRQTRSRASSNLTTPAVHSSAPPDETHYFHHAEAAQHGMSDQSIQVPKPATEVSIPTDGEDQGWNRWLLTLQLFTGPLFAVFIVWANVAEDLDQPLRTLVKAILISLVCSLVMLGVLLLTTTEDRRPRFHFLFCFLGFIIAVAWISTIAGEVVGVLKAFGVILDISEAILGLTIFAVGNSVGDLVADVTVARLGYPVMALAACFGGPMLNILLGIGLGGAYQTIQTANKSHSKHPDRPIEYKPYHIQVGGTLMVSALVLLVTLLALLIAVPMNDWMMTKRIGWGLVALWAVGTVVNVIIETTGLWRDVA
ncbi:Sodium/calcium exchanger protein-domain-containing protein [Xylariales sp. PMI_506]|nr:Sodium/calcium exchanger protein-domain-containing protein [Xylariales sp. PMI_506]